MQIIKIYPKGFAANTYLLTSDGKNAVAIDPAQPSVAAEARRRGLFVRYVLLTHGHFDHIGGCAALQQEGAKIGCLDAEKSLAVGKDNLAEYFGCPVSDFSVDFTVRDGENIDLCGMNFRVIATPGHTAGGACYFCENALFTGDTLFEGDVGRVDLPTGSGAALEASLEKLFAQVSDADVYPGHGENTTLAQERRMRT